VNGTKVAEKEALNYLQLNKIGGQMVAEKDAKIEFGYWNEKTKVFQTPVDVPSAVRVTAASTHQPLFFARIFGDDEFTVRADAICVCQPRDIVLVLDYSGSMCFDSQFRNLSLLGKTTIEQNLKRVWQDLGSPTYGTLAWAPVSYGDDDTSKSAVKAKFGLNKVSYPYPGGSWDDFIDYVQEDDYVQAAGYKCKYGMMTFVNYIQAKQGSYSDTPVLWKTSQQPVTALKDATDEFFAYLQAHSTDDQVGFSLYSYSDDKAYLETKLTKDLSKVSSLVRARQAGHYASGTNISAGMTKARTELQTNARPGAKKLMLLMTDGVVNLPTGSTSKDKQAVIDEANLAAKAKIPIVTIALGAYADTALMKQVADITGGAAFVVPGGQSISKVKEQLEAVFAQVAASRPLKLVE
jgi:hypothetical protein